MNTTAKGNAYEDKVFSYFSSLVQKEELGTASKRHSKLYQHKRYPCVGYNREIDVDISIENFNSPSCCTDTWSSLVVIECKCYNHTVDIADYDEFCKKLQYISEYGVKGIMVTTTGFSSTTIEMARKMHIGLVVMSDERTDWLVSRDLNVETEHMMSILRGEQSLGRIPIVYNEGSFIHSIDLLEKLDVATTNENLVLIPYLSDQAISDRVEGLLSSFKYKPTDIVGEVWAKVFSDYKISFEQMNQGLYAKLDPGTKVLWLSNDLMTDENRRNFSLAHEIGHLSLHISLFRHFGLYEEGQSKDYYHYLSIEMQKRLECQANTFASYLLMPDKWFFPVVKQLFRKYSITTGRLYLDNQSCNQVDVNNILTELSRHFGVSKQATKVRLKKAGLLIEAQQPSRIRDLLR